MVRSTAAKAKVEMAQASWHKTKPPLTRQCRSNESAKAIIEVVAPGTTRHGAWERVDKRLTC